MKKFIAIILALVFALGCCSALADTTEARSGTISVKVLQYELSKTTGVDKMVKTSTGDVLVVKNDQNRDTKWTITVNGKTVTKTEGKTATITAKDVLDNVTESKLVTIVVNGESKGGNGSYYNVKAPVTFQIKVVVDGEDISDEDEKKPKQDPNEATKGKFTCTISGPKNVYEGDPIKLTVTPNVANDLSTMIGTYTTSYKVYIMKNGEEVGSIATLTDGEFQYAVLADSEYSFWAIATLAF